MEGRKDKRDRKNGKQEVKEQKRVDMERRVEIVLGGGCKVRRSFEGKEKKY